MKKYLLYLPLLCLPAMLRAQTDTVAAKISKIPYKHVDALAKFPQGDFKDYISNKLQYSRNIENSIKGQIVLLTEIGADGSITQVTILKSLSPVIDQEIVKVINSSPKWKPAVLNKQNVSMQMVFNIDIAVKGNKLPAAVKQAAPVPQTPVSMARPANNTIAKPMVSIPVKAVIPAHKPAIVITKNTLPTPVKKIELPTKKTVPPVIKRPIAVVAKKVEPPAKKVIALPVAKKTPPPAIAKKVEPPAKKVIPPPVVKKTVPPPAIAKKVVPPIKKILPPPVVKKIVPPPVIAKKVEPPVKKATPLPIVKKAVLPPVIAKKVEPPVKKTVPVVAKKVESPIKKSEPLIAKKVKRKTIRDDLFNPSSHSAIFPGGGLPAFFRYLGQNITYPAESKKAGIEGKVILSFVIEEDGSVSDVDVLSSPAEDLSQEAIRVLLASPRWKPAMQNKRPVAISYQIPINFTLTERSN